MEELSPQFFILTLALVGVVIIVAALLSGFIDRSDIPQVGVFLALGAILGPSGLQLLDVSLDSPILRVAATLSLVLSAPRPVSTPAHSKLKACCAYRPIKSSAESPNSMYRGKPGSLRSALDRTKP